MEEKEIKQLNVGDIIYDDNRWGSLYKYVIDKVTNTTASSGNYKFQRSYSDGKWMITIPRQKGFHGSNYQLATKELDDKYERQSLLNFIGNNYKKAELFQLRQIKGILK